MMNVLNEMPVASPDVRLHVPQRYVDGDEVKYTSTLGLAELSQALRALPLAPNGSG